MYYVSLSSNKQNRNDNNFQVQVIYCQQFKRIMAILEGLPRNSWTDFRKTPGKISGELPEGLLKNSLQDVREIP